MGLNKYFGRQYNAKLFGFVLSKRIFQKIITAFFKNSDRRLPANFSHIKSPVAGITRCRLSLQKIVSLPD